MKKSLAIFLFALAGWLVPAQAGVVSLSTQAGPGSLFDVSVNVNGVFDAPHESDSLLAYGFDLVFDHTAFSYLGETAGPLFTDLSGQPGLTAQVAGFATNILLNPGDFTEPLRLATLHFNAVAPGPLQIGITGDPANLDQGLLYLSGSEAIAASTAVPEPAALSTLGAGYLVLLALRRSR